MSGAGNYDYKDVIVEIKGKVGIIKASTSNTYPDKLTAKDSVDLA